MLPRRFQSPTPFPWSVVRTRTPNQRVAGALVFAVLVGLITACSTAPPTRRDVVVGLVGEPRTVFDDDPSARFIASAVTETLVRRDAHDELVPRLAESVPTLENGVVPVLPLNTGAARRRPAAARRPSRA